MIRRYKVKMSNAGMLAVASLVNDLQGEWVKYEDVKHLIEPQPTTWQPSPELWEQYPDANWIAVDMDGWMHCYESVSHKDDYKWYPNGWKLPIVRLKTDQMGDWRKMIWRRPDET